MGGLSAPGFKLIHYLRFFTYPVLAALLAPLALVVTARVSRMRAAPVLVILVVFVIGLGGAVISRLGFAWVQPESFLAEEIAKDPPRRSRWPTRWRARTGRRREPSIRFS